MRLTAHQPSRSEALLPVHDLSDIEYLVKESEILTGQAGRGFVIAGADRLIYRVHWHPAGFTVERLSAHGEILDSRQLLPWDFEEHALAHALACGQLFTASVPSDTDACA